MWFICKKEWQQFFNSLTGYIAIVVFLLFNSLWLFVFPDTNLLDFGYASLSSYFDLCPWVLLFLVPTVAMRSFSDEYKSGTFELLKTMPLTPTAIVWGKFFGVLIIILLALLPTTIYAIAIQTLSITGGIDIGSSLGSYIGLCLLGAVFTAICLCASSFTNNTVVAFITGAFACFLLFGGFEALSKLPIFYAGPDYYIEMSGIKFHYNAISRGVVDMGDMVYFCGIIVLFLFITARNARIVNPN